MFSFELSFVCRSMAEGSSDKFADMNQEVEGDFKLSTVTQLNDLTTKISEVKN